MATIKEDLQKDSVGSAYVELFIIDGREFEPTLYFKLTPSSDSPIGFGSYGTFEPFPIQGEGWETTTGQPPRPKLTISNVTKLIQPYVQHYQDLTRVKVLRIRTLEKYLDHAEFPDESQHFPIETWYIESIITQNKATMQFELVTPIDLPNVKFPLGQMLRDETGIAANCYAPGLSRTRIR